MTKAQKKEVIRRIKAGETRAAIAADMGFAKEYLRLIWNNYQLLGEASFAPPKFGPENLTHPKRKPPTTVQKKKIRTLLEASEDPLTIDAMKKRIKDQLGLTVSRKILVGLVSDWQLEVAPGTPPAGTGNLPTEEFAGILKREDRLRKDLQRRLESEDRAEWQLFGLPRGNRRDGPGPQWRKRQYEQNKDNYFYLEFWTAGPQTLLTPESRELLKRKIHFYSKHLGINVLSFVIMDSHCFLLVHLPPRQAWIDKLRDPRKFLRRAKEFYQPAVYERIAKQFRVLTDQSKLVDYYLGEFCDLSSFVKQVKESVSRAHNLHQNSTGSLWMERYRSLELTTRSQRIASHLRINRWPVTRGVLEPGELPAFPWSSFGELQANSKRAIKGTCRALGIPVVRWKKPYPDDHKPGRKRTAQKWFYDQVLAP